MTATVRRLTVGARREFVATARHWVRARVEEAGVPTSVALVVELLTSELVANAVLHGHGAAVDVVVRLGPDGCTVEVADAGEGMPVVRRTGPEVPGGQGMRLVERLAEDWGCRRTADGGKAVWFAVPTGCEPSARLAWGVRQEA